jgi:hypothetical protein
VFQRLTALAVLAVPVVLACESAPPPEPATFTPDPDVVRIATDHDLYLSLRDAPRALTASVTRRDGVTDTVRISSIATADTAIVRVMDSALVPLRVGRAELQLVVAGRPIVARAYVRNAVADETIALSPGEVRAWELIPGWYEIEVQREDSTVNSSLELAAPLTCAPHSLKAEAISCRVRDTTRIVLKHSGRGARSSARVSIVQVGP